MSGGGGGGSTDEFCAATVYNNSNSAETASAALLTIENVDASSMKVTVTSADADPVDDLIVNNSTGPITGSPAVSLVDSSVPGELSVTLTWTGTPPSEVELNVLWSKVSFGGNWQLVTPPANATVSFNADCGGGGGGGGSTLSLPITFEDDMLDYEFNDFGGNATVIITDPEDSGNKVAQSTKGTAMSTSEIWAGTTVADMSGLGAIPFTSENTTMSVTVWSPTAGVPVRLKVEDKSDGAISVETEATITAANTWETLVFDFSNQASGTAALNTANTYDKASIFFDFGTGGNGEVYYWDDVQFGGDTGGGGGSGSIELPVTFEDEALDYEFNDFGGNATEIITDPEDSGNKVAQSTKGTAMAASEVWAGTTVAETSGFGAIPFTSENTTMSVRVWSSTAGVPIRLKVEDKSDGAISVETEATITAANTWETLVFDFSNQASGTAALNTANTYDKASIFFDFGTAGNGEVYYWDDVQFGGDSGGGGGSSSIELPVTFEDEALDYEFNDFGGNATEIITDPEDSGNKVAQSTKGTAMAASEVWAGTTVAETSGFGAIPFTSENTTMSVRVWSSTAGVPIRLKVEDKSDGAISVETEATITAANTWETLVFDFSNQASGTAALNTANTYDKASIFFDFGTAGNGEVYYWDDVQFGGDSGGGGGTGEEGVYCETTVYNNSNSAETTSAALLTIENVDASSMKVTITSADSDPVDALIVNNSSGPITGSPGVSETDDSVEGELSVTLTWTDTPPAEVELNVLWSKVSFEGNWQLVTPPANVTVAFDASCDGGGGGGSDIELPITFEDESIDYEITDFGGNASMIVADPNDSENNVVQSVKGSSEAASEVWAGTTVGEDSGFGAIPFTAENTTISVRVLSPASGIPVRLKVEDISNSSISVETEATTTVADEWETLVFDFSNEVSGTSALDIANTYDKASIFFNFDTAESGTVYYWDDVAFGGETGGGASSVATLSELLVNSESVNRFDPETFEYYVEFPEGTTDIPVVTATPTEAVAMVTVTNPTELPGFATIVVVSEDESNTNTYTIEYAIDENLSKDATLSDLQVNGVTIDGFDSETFAYSIELEESVTTVPTVTATTTDGNASVVIEDAISLPGSSKVIVTAEDGTTERNYSIEFTYPEGTEVTYTVTGMVSADGSAFTDGNVVIYQIDDINNTKSASLSSDGSYVIESLDEGSYYIYVASNSEDFVTTFYGDVSTIIDPNATPSLIVMDRNRVADISMVAKPSSAVETVENGATINFQAQEVNDGSSRIVTGRVSQGDALANVLVILTTMDEEYVADGITDSEGFVSFDGLPTGDYIIFVEVPGVGRVSSEVSAVEGEESVLTGLIDEDGIVINTVLGLDDNLLEDITVYPNPTVERLNIEAPRGLNLSDYSISIIGLSGKVFNAPSVLRDSNIQIDVSSLETGVYFIRLTTENGTTDRRFIKQ